MNRLAIGAGGVAALAAVAAAAFLLMRGPPPSSGEEGIFENDCCGSVTLARGRLSVNGSQQTVGYDVGRDAHGPYLLPRTYVGAVVDVGFDIDGTQPARKLRLDHLPGPQTIELPMGTRAFVFKRKRVLAQQP